MYDSHVDVRTEAARSLGMLKDPRAVDALVENIGYGLFFNPDLQAITDLNENIVHPNYSIGDTFVMLHDNCKWALIQIGEPSVEPLLKALNSRSPYIRAAAAQTLGCLKCQRALEPIRSLLNNPRSFVREAASWAAGNI